MTDMELAEEIERRRLKRGHAVGYEWLNSDECLGMLLKEHAEQIIAALRRGPSDDPKSSGYIPLCGSHAETWFTGRNHLKDGMKATCVVCAFERPPSGEMVMVPMPDAIVAVGAQSVQLSYFGGNRNEVIALLKRSAAESSKEAK